ncbi:MAG: hypothetical protein U0457_08040 [Candidatus Sericytochromatia bacterium]
MIKKIVALSLLTLVFSCDNKVNNITGNNQNNATGKVSFASVKSVIGSKCISCHNAGNSSGGVNLSTDEKIISQGGEITEQVSKKKMPPRSSGMTMTDDEIKLISDWVLNGSK